MGHKQMFNTSQYFEIEQDWSHGHPASGQSYVHMGMLLYYVLLSKNAFLLVFLQNLAQMMSSFSLDSH
jgi:hypothetical protein